MQFGALAHFIFPPAVHQHLSVNDNGLHGPAKVAWRARRDFHMSDDVRTSLALLQELDHVEGENIRQAFRVNLQLGREPTEAGALEAMGHDRRQISPWHAACQREFRVWSGQEQGEKSLMLLRVLNRGWMAFTPVRSLYSGIFGKVKQHKNLKKT